MTTQYNTIIVLRQIVTARVLLSRKPTVVEYKMQVVGI